MLNLVTQQRSRLRLPSSIPPLADLSAPLQRGVFDDSRNLSMALAAFVICFFLTVSSCALRMWTLFRFSRTLSILLASRLLGVVVRMHSRRFPFAPLPASRRIASVRDSFFPFARYRAL